MHEWGIASSIIEKIIRSVKENNLTVVKRIKLNLGRKLGIEREEFLFCLKSQIKEGPLKKSKFIIEENDSGLVDLEFIEGD